LLAVIAEKEVSLIVQDQQLQTHVQQIQTNVKTIKHHEHYIGLLEEQLNMF